MPTTRTPTADRNLLLPGRFDMPRAASYSHGAYLSDPESAKLRRARYDVGVSLEQLAARTGYSVTQLEALERGRLILLLRDWRRVFQALAVCASDMRTANDTRPNDTFTAPASA